MPEREPGSDGSFKPFHFIPKDNKSGGIGTVLIGNSGGRRSLS